MITLSLLTAFIYSTNNVKGEYVLVSTSQTGTEAQQYCEDNYLNGNLASISDSTENQVVIDTCAGNTCWIGLQNYPTLEWYDGTAYPGSFTNWSPGEPDGGAAQPCVMINSAGLWITGGCDNQLQSACEFDLYPSLVYKKRMSLTIIQSILYVFPKSLRVYCTNNCQRSSPVLILTNIYIVYIYTASFSYAGAATGLKLGGVTLSVPVDITFDNRFTNGLSSDIPVLTMVDPTGENQIGFYGVSFSGQIPMRMDVIQDGVTSSYQCQFCTGGGCITNAQSWTAEIRNNYANLYYGSTLCGSISFSTPIKSSGLQGAQLSVTLSNALTSSSNVNIVSPAATDDPTTEPTLEPTTAPTTGTVRIFVDEFMTFSQAQAYCASTYGGYLASITSAEENAIIQTMCEDVDQLQSACWLGLGTPYTSWDDGSAVTYNDWYPGEPDGFGSQPCTTIRTGGPWFTVGYCETDPLPFICEYEPQQKLIFVPTPATLAEAIEDCRTTYDGDLASIHSADDNTAYAEACQDIQQFQNACLLGLTNPVSTWSDGSTIDYTNWYPGEPDGVGTQPVVSIRQGGDWHTIGDEPLPYVCYGYQVTDAPSAEPTAGPTVEPTTAEPTTADPTTADPTTANPTTANPTTAEPTTADPTTADPTTAEPSTAEPTTSMPTAAESADPDTTTRVFVEELMTFSEAQEYCASIYGGYLPSITSAEENAIIGAMCENVGQIQTACWLGLEAPFTIFDDGQAVTYSDSWYPGEPDAPDSQPCTTIRGTGEFPWFTVGYCETESLPFICEYESCDSILATARAHYTGDSYDSTTKLWSDITGNGRDVTVSGTAAEVITDSKSGEIYLRGAQTTGVTFSADLLGDNAATAIPYDYTLIHVCRHVDDGWPSRIWDGKTAFTGDDAWLNTQSYWYSGFDGWGNPRVKRDGTANHMFCQITEWVDNIPGYDWILSVDQVATYRGNGVDFTVDPATCDVYNPTHDNKPIDQPFIATINAGNRYNWQKSSWDCAEVIAFDYELDIDQIEKVEQCLIEKYAIDETAAPTSSPTPINDACPASDYAIAGVPCIADGDPHFTMWNGAIHHFQGMNNEQYYYIAPCQGVSDEEMPFKVLATHSWWTPGSSVQRVRYIVFELYESSTVQYLFFTGPAIIDGYINVDDASGTLYEDNVDLAGYSPGSTQSIGTRFAISKSGNQYVLLIDDECEVVFYFVGSTLTIEPPECYRCFACGLCGDFKREPLTSGYQTIETCDGGYTTISKPGWSAALSDPFTFDLNGNTWGKSYCDSTRRRLQDVSGGLDTTSSSICNDGRDSSAYVEEIGDDMVAYCQVDDIEGHSAYVAPTPSGDASMYYDPSINENGETGAGYVIYHEGGIKAYCLDETDPLDCAYKWVTRDWDSNTWYIDTNMNTLSCDACVDEDSESDSDSSWGGLYTPELPDDFTVSETCDPLIEPLVIEACQAARDDATACCDFIGDNGKLCNQLQSYCEIDGCLVVGTNASAIDKNVDELFTESINLICSIPDVASKFSEDNLVANNESTIVEDTFPVWKDTCPPFIEGCVAENSCIACDDSCGSYCQCIGCGENYVCGVNDCMTCENEEDYELVVVYADGTGYCEEIAMNETSTGGDGICNDGRDSSAYVEEIGDDMVGYCQVDDINDYPAYVAPTPSGDAEMYYEEDINENGESGAGYVIYHEGGIKAYCLNEKNPLNCAYKWVTRDWDSSTWYIDTNMNTLRCDVCDEGEVDSANIYSVVYVILFCLIILIL